MLWQQRRPSCYEFLYDFLSQPRNKSQSNQLKLLTCTSSECKSRPCSVLIGVNLPQFWEYLATQQHTLFALWPTLQLLKFKPELNVYVLEYVVNVCIWVAANDFKQPLIWEMCFWCSYFSRLSAGNRFLLYSNRSLKSQNEAHVEIYCMSGCH